MRQTIVDFIMAYLQDNPEHLAGIIGCLFVWNCLNTLFAFLVALSLDRTHGALRRLAFKVTGRFDLR